MAWLLVAGEAMSEIKSDERVVFFPTAAHLSEDGGQWILPIHGWVFEPEESSRLRGAAVASMRELLGLSSDEAAGRIFAQRARLFLVDNERGKKIAVQIGQGRHTLEPSDRDGHFSGTVEIDAETACSLADGGRLPLRAVTDPDDERHFGGYVHLVPPEGISVISDIDDTIKITEVTSKRELVKNTFLRPFRAVDGMAAVYGKWAQAGAMFHFVSASPWQLYEPLQLFAAESGFPEATFHLKRVRLKDSSVWGLLADPLETKRGVLGSILKQYPRRRFVFVGDSGERDPEVYGLIAREYPEQVRQIFIRDVTGQSSDDPRYGKALGDLPPETSWRVFRDPAELPRDL
jgi:phosphatidate phosphatase APP1